MKWSSNSAIVQNLYSKIFDSKNYQNSRTALFLFVLNYVNLINTYFFKCVQF